MECPECKGDVDINLLSIQQNADEDGIEINFCCRLCQGEFYAVLMPDDFNSVD